MYSGVPAPLIWKFGEYHRQAFLDRQQFLTSDSESDDEENSSIFCCSRFFRCKKEVYRKEQEEIEIVDKILEILALNKDKKTVT